MKTRYYWPPVCQDVRWKTTDYDGSTVEWFDAQYHPIPNRVRLKWEGNGIKRVLTQKLQALDEYGYNMWTTTLEENPYFVRSVKDPEVGDKDAPLYSMLHKDIEKLQVRVQTLEDLLDSMAERNLELTKLLIANATDAAMNIIERDNNELKLDIEKLNIEWWKKYEKETIDKLESRGPLEKWIDGIKRECRGGGS